MRKIYLAGVTALFISLTACGRQPDSTSEQAGAAKEPPEATTAAIYSATGSVTSVSDQDVTISHGPVPDLQWPAMTMTFRAPSANLLSGVAPGDRVSFAFREADDGYVLTSLTKN